MKKILIFIAILLTIFILKEDEKYITIPNEAIRYRIIPNSNTAVDIYAKEEIQKEVEGTLENIMTATSLEESREKIKENIGEIEKTIEKVKNTINYDKPVNVKYGLNYFPQKEYNGVIYEEGYYESLVVEIGDAKGDNFWCVLFPPLCMLETSEETDEIEYRIGLLDIINKFF